VLSFLKNSSDKERLILLTHCHFDHIGDADRLRSATNTKIAIGEFDNNSLSDPNKNLCNLFGADLKPFSADITLIDGEIVSVGDIEIKVIHTPGHTLGGVCYLIDDILFSGDTLFSGSIGRTDFPDGDFAILKNSVNKLYQLPESTKVYSGHGEATTIDYEKKYNPFIRG
jgi:glyoxylase-like metal-dependent hydrolase (beta-lactamase superfamily II)